MKERAMLFGEAKSLVGVVTEPEGGAAAGRPALIFLNAGVLHRVGPNRIHVRLARALADAGFSSLRFDQSGLGDSPPRHGGSSFVQAMVEDTRQAMDALGARTGATSFVLAGICSGADNALRAAVEDDRVRGAILIEAYTVPSRGHALYSYRHRLLSPRSWWRLLRGRSELLSDLRSSPPAATASPPAGAAPVEPVLPSREAFVASVRRLLDRGVRLCLVYADTSPAYFNYRRLLERRVRRAPAGQVQVQVLSRTDHVFTPLDVQERLLRGLCGWCDALPGPG